MSVYNYCSTTRWKTATPLEDVADLFTQVERYSDWLSLCKHVKTKAYLVGHGAKVGLDLKGWLPFRIHLELTVRCNRTREHFQVDVQGDLEGAVACLMEQSYGKTHLICLSNLQARSPVLRAFSFLFRPLCISNQNWILKRIWHSLEEELRFRRAIQPTIMEWAKTHKIYSTYENLGLDRNL